MNQLAPDRIRALIRFNALALALALGVIGGLALLIATFALTLHGGDVVGPLLGQLRYFFPGYTVTFSGAFVGAFWAGATGFGFGGLLGLAYGRWMITGPVAESSPAASADDVDPLQPNVRLLGSMRFAAVSGGLLALSLFLATNWLWLTTGEFSPHLFLLHNYLPGFTPDFIGSLFGSFWLFLYGAIGARSVAWVYDFVVKRRTRIPG
jgi:hypothetical protein